MKEHDAYPPPAGAADTRPILIVPYMWIGDFVRGHSAVRLLKARFPDRPIDMLATPPTAALVEFMPGVRRAILSDFPRGRLALAKQREVARRLRAEHYDTVLVLPRTWKSALAPFLAGIPERIGFFGEARFVLLNDLRWGERRIDRMIDHMGALTLPAGAPLPKDWPPPQLIVPPAEIAAWRAAHDLSASGQPVVALCPGAVGPGKQWPSRNFAEFARALTAEGVAVWVLGGPNETPIAREIAAAGGAGVRDLTGRDLRDAILALAAADTAVANDSGLMHVAAAAGTPPVGLYGPTDPHLYEPLNPVAAQVEPPGGPCPTCGREACPVILHRRVEDIRVDQVLDAVRGALTAAKQRTAGPVP
jgi:heptosyltransferase II